MTAFSSPTTPAGTESPSFHFQDSAVCPRLSEEGCAVGQRLSAEAPHDCAQALIATTAYHRERQEQSAEVLDNGIDYFQGEKQ
jgi:hypothetical protein